MKVRVIMMAIKMIRRSDDDGESAAVDLEKQVQDALEGGDQGL